MKRYLLASDFDQTLSFNDSGIVLSELLGISDFREKAAGLSRIHLVQQGAELAYLLLHDPEYRRVRKEHLIGHGVKPEDFNSYGARRGNHEVMVRGTFANVRLKNLLAPGTEGPVTLHLPDGEQMTIYDASVKYQAEGVPLIVIAGKEYGSGSSRDWAAKGPRLLGVRAVIAQSYERIHRSNLVGMGILPLQFLPNETPEKLGLTGKEVFEITGLGAVLTEGFPRGKELVVRATRPDGSGVQFTVTVRIDTPQELQYYCHGGILEYVLRQLLAQGAKP